MTLCQKMSTVALVSEIINQHSNTLIRFTQIERNERKRNLIAQKLWNTKWNFHLWMFCDLIFPCYSYKISKVLIIYKPFNLQFFKTLLLWGVCYLTIKLILFPDTVLKYIEIWSFNVMLLTFNAISWYCRYQSYSCNVKSLIDCKNIG